MINQVTLVGRLTRDPDLRVTPEGTPVTHVTIAVNRQYKNQNGQIEADFVQCTLWRKAAENTVKFCRKGSVVGVTGRIQTRNYENSEGRKVYVTEVVAEAIQFLGKKTSESEPEPVSAGSRASTTSYASHAPIASHATHASQASQASKVSQVSHASQASQAPHLSQAPHASQAPHVSHASQAPYTSQAPHESNASTTQIAASKPEAPPVSVPF